MNGALSFISEALAQALTSDVYDEKELRIDLQSKYFAISVILDRCIELKEAEGMLEMYNKHCKA